MEPLLKKKDDWSESVSGSNGGESKESSSSSNSNSSSSGSSSHKVRGSGSPPLLGWPIRRAITTTPTKDSDDDKVGNQDDKFKKMGSRING